MKVMIYVGFLFLALTCLPDTEGISHLQKQEKIKGIHVFSRMKMTTEHFQSLDSLNLNWMALVPYGYQRPDVPYIFSLSRNGFEWSERDSGIIQLTELAKSKNLKVMIKPQIWLWRGMSLGELQFESDSSWNEWFDSYEVWMMHYAQLAESVCAEMLCIGTETLHASTKFTQRWQQLIDTIRTVYSGKLTYAANWYLEYEGIQFWDQLDYIGVQAYFPLTKEKQPTVEQIKTGWKPILSQLETFADRWKKPIIFTEIGYKATKDATIEPWTWLDRRQTDSVNLDFKLQSDAYEAFFQSVWSQSWFQGVFIWNYIQPTQGFGMTNRPMRGPNPMDFSPQRKPASETISRWFQSSKP